MILRNEIEYCNGVDVFINKICSSLLFLFIISIPFISHMELKDLNPFEKLKFISFCHLARMYWATQMNGM